jgi:hypothetical protein
LVVLVNVTEEPGLIPECGGSRFLRNAGTYLSVYTPSYLRFTHHRKRKPQVIVAGMVKRTFVADGGFGRRKVKL